MSLPASGISGTDPALRSLAGLLCDHAGWNRQANSPGFAAAARRASAAAGFGSTADYAAALATRSVPIAPLVDEAAVGESTFFREPERLTWAWRDAASSNDARIWSAGCAMGEEPYSLAILAEEDGAAARVSIFATDISLRATNRARAARYTDWQLRGTDPACVSRWFTRGGDGSERHLDPAIAARVRLEPHNLVSGPPAAAPSSGFDLVLCRNVLVYFDPSRIADAARVLIGALRPGGVLLTGVADPLLDVRAFGAVPVPCPGGVAYRSTEIATASGAPARRQ